MPERMPDKATACRRVVLRRWQVCLCICAEDNPAAAAEWEGAGGLLSRLRTISSTIIKSYALANLINGISLAAIQIRNDSG